MPEGLTIVSRINRPAVQVLPVVSLLLLFGCSRPVRERTQANGNSTASRVEAIQIESKRIDAALEASETPKVRRVRKDLPYWQFSGLFESSTPIFLSALFLQGQVVRLETYYLVSGKLLRVRIEQWWDVDDASQAPEPRTRQDFYIENDRTIRHVIELESSPPISRTNDTTRPAAALVERSRSIAQIMVGGAQDAALARSLEVFPDADISKP